MTTWLTTVRSTVNSNVNAAVSSSECRTRVYVHSKIWCLIWRSLVRSASPSLPGRSLVLFRSVNVTATYSLTVEQELMLWFGFRANIRPGKCERREYRRKTDFSYREIGSLEGTRDATPSRDWKNKHFLSLYSFELHSTFSVLNKNNSKNIPLCIHRRVKECCWIIWLFLARYHFHHVLN